MTTLARDPKGYYAILGLAPGADDEAIRAAYRRRVKTVHPDLDPSARAREEFRRLIEAYAVLKDTLSRAEYDGDTPAAPVTVQSVVPPPPVTCGQCGVLTAQPRHVVFRTVRSYLIWARLGRLEGVFCRDCADHAAARASVVTWLWGWWSLPGLILTPLALAINLFGGQRPRRENVALLIRQARMFQARGDLVLARSLAIEARAFAREAEDHARIAALIRATEAVEGDRRLKNRWRRWGGRAFLAQALPLLALPATVAVFVLIATRPWDRPVATASAAIAVQPAAVGEIRHVAVDGLKLRMAPLPGAPVLTLLDRFATVEITAATDPDWVGVRTPSGIDGFVEARALYAGSGERFKSEWCAENRGGPPAAGEVLIRRVSGDHRLLVHNDGRRDGVVKLKTLAGSTVMAVYVPATFHIGVGGIPDGTYRIEYATGTRYSRGCGVFIDDMVASVLPMTVTFHYRSPTAARSLTRIAEIWLAPTAESGVPPLPLTVDRFAADD